ncbi:HAD-IA family hydrolase [Microbacterium saperdae]|uniref:Putative hydrolase of the HAD superfamily n=1 Tax=Microbacterium saperdae TaxID=69368 RepID=A0A543B9P5_9MICO|nr:HAD-IA family hydrolase [Microbacterium saperdae]TQL81532.1 putative hydrolase of the HAD superfamily [Microbacterium saperdae]GGM59693.1 haloacid dehalogenase [Microbacterium saperdae]
MIRAVLFDLEARHGLEVGAIARAAFRSPVIEDVTTGRITRAEWLRRIGEHTGAAEAVDEWGRTAFRVDRDLTALADELRAHGLIAAILTNGTDTIAAEIASCGLDHHFSPIFNSAEIGFAKPDPRAFRYVLDTLALPADQVFFTDDSPSKLVGAAGLGLHTHPFTGVEALRSALRDCGVDVRAAAA